MLRTYDTHLLMNALVNHLGVVILISVDGTSPFNEIFACALPWHLNDRLSELDDLAEALVDLTPVLAEVNGAEAEDVVAEGVVLVGDIDVGLGIDHDALCLQGVWDSRVLLVLDVTLDLADVVGAKVLVDTKAGDKHLLVILGVEDDALAFFRVVKSNIGLHYRQQLHIFCVDGVEVEGNPGATYNRILFAAFLVIEVAQEGLEDAVHHVLVTGEVDEAVFARALFVRQHIGVQHFADADDEAVEAVVAVESNILESASVDVYDSDLRESAEGAEEVFLDVLVKVLVPEEPVHRGVNNLVVQDVASEVIKGADGLTFTVPVGFDCLGEFQFPFDAGYLFLVGAVFFCDATLQENIGTFGQEAGQEIQYGWARVGIDLHPITLLRKPPGIAQEVIEVLYGNLGLHRYSLSIFFRASRRSLSS